MTDDRTASERLKTEEDQKVRPVPPPPWALARPDILAALKTRPGHLRLALTGGAASGKSRTAELLESLGAVSVDLDRLARQATAPGTPGLAAGLELLGPDFIGPDGELDRAGTGRAVFADPGLRRRLEEILHPLIWESLGRALAELEEAPAVAVGAPLLFEAGLETFFQPVVLVFARPETQIRRLLARRPDFRREEAEALLAAQGPAAQKAARADFVINNDGPWAETERQVRALWARLIDSAALL